VCNIWCLLGLIGYYSLMEISDISFLLGSMGEHGVKNLIWSYDLVIGHNT